MFFALLNLNRTRPIQQSIRCYKRIFPLKKSTRIEAVDKRPEPVKERLILKQAFNNQYKQGIRSVFDRPPVDFNQRNDSNSIANLNTRRAPIERSEPPKSGQPQKFRDAYLLTEKIRRLLDKKTDRASEAMYSIPFFAHKRELVTRSQAIANNEVYGTLMTCLLRKGHPLYAIKSYDEMTKSRRIAPNAQSYTLFFTAIGRAASTASASEKRVFMQRANDVYLGLERGTSDKTQRVHLNSILKVCVSCADEGGWERAFKLFNAVASSPDRITSLDTIGISIMLSLCAANRSNDGYKACLHIWNTFKQLQAEEAAENIDKRARLLNVDARLIMNVLLTCIRTKDYNDSLFGLELVREYIGLPCSTSDKFFYKDYRREIKEHTKHEIDSKSLDVLLRYASRIKNPDLALLCICVKELGITTDDSIQESVVQLLIEKKDFVTALDVSSRVSENKRSNKHALTIKICHEALQQKSILANPKQFFVAFEEAVHTLWSLSETKISAETFQSIFEVVYEKQMYKNLFPLLNRVERRGEIIEGARVAFEKALAQAEDGKCTSLVQYLEGGNKGPGYHAQKETECMQTTLRVILKSVKEFEEFGVKPLSGDRRGEVRVLQLVAKQVQDVLEVWDAAQGAIDEARRANERFASQIEQRNNQ